MAHLVNVTDNLGQLLVINLDHVTRINPFPGGSQIHFVDGKYVQANITPNQVALLRPLVSQLA